MVSVQATSKIASDTGSKNCNPPEGNFAGGFLNLGWPHTGSLAFRHQPSQSDSPKVAAIQTSGGIMMQWRKCSDYPNYEVSEFGDVRRATTGRGATVGKLMRPFKSNGYLKYTLSTGGEPSNVFAHRLVAMAFLGPPPFDGALACHRDGSRTENHYSNLRWDTQKGNVADAIEHGTFRPVPPSLSILIPEEVRQIRLLLEAGELQKDIAQVFNISRQNISRIAQGEIWKDVA